MASLLFIAPADLGEAVLATGALAHVAAVLGDVEITVVCHRDAKDLYRATASLKAIETWDGALGGPWLGLTARALTQPFDLCVDLADAPPSYLINARQTFRRSPPRVLYHLIEEFAELLNAPRPLTPHLSLDERARSRAAAFLADPSPLLVIAPGGNAAAKRWPAENFAAVARRLAGDPIPNAIVVVQGAAARDGALTGEIAASLAADGVDARDLQGIDLLAAAALMERATLCVGNDNALAHIAAAMGTPTLTLFGPTDERVRAPSGPRARTVRGQSFEDSAAAARLDAQAGMAHLSIDTVEAAARELLHAGGLR